MSTPGGDWAASLVRDAASPTPDRQLAGELLELPVTPITLPEKCAECGTAWRYMADETHRAGRALCHACAIAWDDALKSQPKDALERDVAREQARRLLAERGSMDPADVLNGLTSVRGWIAMAQEELGECLADRCLDDAITALDALVAKARAAQKGGRS